MKPRLFTGIQPTGQLHIGNYLGVIKNSILLQEKYDSLFCVVDLHALTVKQDTKTFKNSILEVARHYLASGIDPKKAILFVQSSVSEHTELCWILNTLAKISELERMTQFKEKALKNNDNLNIGLFDYPVLMAADILLYNTAVVPVGDDQKQHLEMTQTLAARFNKRYAKIFTVPMPLIKKRIGGSRIMGLDDPNNKMSKTADSEYNYIALTDSPEKGIQKIMKATTDSGSTITLNQNSPGITNLLTIYYLLTNIKIKDLEKKYLGKQYSEFKKDLAELVGQFLQDHQEKLDKYSDKQVTQILTTGSQKAKEIASQKMKEIKSAVGLN